MTTALILIDVQQSFVHRPYFQAEPAAAFLARTNALIDGCASRGIPVVRIFHVDGPNQADNPFSPASGHVRPIGLGRRHVSRAILREHDSTRRQDRIAIDEVRSGICRKKPWDA